MDNILPTVFAGVIYLVPFVIALLVLKKFFEMAQTLKEGAEAQKQVAATQREQTEMLRELMRMSGDMSNLDSVRSEREQD